LRVLTDPTFDLRDQLSLPRLDALQLVDEALLEFRDVAAPVPEPLLDRALHGKELLAEARARVALALGHVTAARFGDPALLLGARSSGSIPVVVDSARRERRTGIESVRWARLAAKANAATAIASNRIVWASTK